MTSFCCFAAAAATAGNGKEEPSSDAVVEKAIGIVMVLMMLSFLAGAYVGWWFRKMLETPKATTGEAQTQSQTTYKRRTPWPEDRDNGRFTPLAEGRHGAWRSTASLVPDGLAETLIKTE